jgi:hypothetical protein
MKVDTSFTKDLETCDDGIRESQYEADTSEAAGNKGNG